jgi:hypothetical protein
LFEISRSKLSQGYPEQRSIKILMVFVFQNPKVKPQKIRKIEK